MAYDLRFFDREVAPLTGKLRILNAGTSCRQKLSPFTFRFDSHSSTIFWNPNRLALFERIRQTCREMTRIVPNAQRSSFGAVSNVELSETFKLRFEG